MVLNELVFPSYMVLFHLFYQIVRVMEANTWFIDLITYKVLNLARLLSSYIIGKSLCVKVSFIWVGLNSTNSQVEKSLIDSLQQTWIIDSS